LPLAAPRTALTRIRAVFARGLLVLGGVLAGLAVSAVVLRAGFPAPETCSILQPSSETIFHPLQGVMPGVSATGHVRVNSRGFRGDEIGAQHKFLAVAVGGSTTECLVLDQERSWPYRLQRLLNERRGNAEAWVGNVGRSGIGTREHLMQLPWIFSSLPRVDLLIVLTGGNDLLRRLGEDDAYDPDFLSRPDAESRLISRAFSVYPRRRDAAMPLYKKTELWARLSWLKSSIERALWPHQVQDAAGKVYVQWRRNRAQATAIRERLPDMGAALAEYSRNLSRIIDTAQGRGARLLFLTQPALWRKDLAAELRSLLWLGGVGDFQNPKVRTEYYSVEALAEGMRLYNDALRELCASRGVECFDLASRLSPDTSVFYDDLHFNDAGSERVAGLLANHLAGETR
jgi:lysophospholipase L1-like esterase